MPIILEGLSGIPRWSKIKFFYDHGLSGLVATSTAAGYDVMNLLNMLDLTYWRATSMDDQYINFSALGPYTANYVAIGDHNLGTAGATISLQCSSDNFASDITDCFTPFVQVGNKAIVVEFEQKNKAYWRLKLSGMSAAPFVGKCIWGQLTELHWASGFDPNAENNKANVTISGTGYLLGIHDTYIERQINLAFPNAYPIVYARLKAWHETVGLNNFFMAWEIIEHPADVYIVRATPTWNNPLKIGGTRRDCFIPLTGRKE